MRHNLALFSGVDFDFLVTACATCTSTIKKLWPLMAQQERCSVRDHVARLADRTLDISQFLVDQHIVAGTGHDDGAARTVPVTYHDPCHLKKSLGVSSQPRTLLAAAGGYRLEEMAGADQCCGMGGSFNLKYYEISSRIGAQKRDAILRSGCRVVATSCPACILQISDALSQAGEGVGVRHVIELYAEHLKRDDRDHEEHRHERPGTGIVHGDFPKGCATTRH
jgi:glycolate oxidase iron-sulfur subunit